MTPREKQYRGTVNRIAISLLLFYVAFSIYSVLMTYVVPLFTDRMSAVAGNVTYELIYGTLYAAVFLLPVWVYYLLSRRHPHVLPNTALTLPAHTPLYILAGLALISAAGYLNSMLLDIFDYASFSDQIFFEYDITLNYQMVLMFFTLVVVPAFVEELLFRGVILQNLLLFGKNGAIIASALLFGVMHQNAGQLLYATVAGLLLGYVYVQTRSFWCCVLIHFCNNFVSLIHKILLERLPEDQATLLIFAMELAVFALGVVAAVYLILHKEKEGDAAFAEPLEAEPLHTLSLDPVSDPVSETDPVSENVVASPTVFRRIRLFCSLPMIAYFVLCAVQMLALLWLALL